MAQDKGKKKSGNKLDLLLKVLGLVTAILNLIKVTIDLIIRLLN